MKTTRSCSCMCPGHMMYTALRQVQKILHRMSRQHYHWQRLNCLGTANMLKPQSDSRKCLRGTPDMRNCLPEFCNTRVHMGGS